MIRPAPGTQIYLYSAPVDMRKSINRLAALVEQVLQRAGIQLARATLAHWVIRCGKLIQPLINLLWDRLLAAPLIH